jgi:hypothetical protein
MSNGQQWDIAISFLARDETTAAELHAGLSNGLNVFFFPRNQEQLAGTDGLVTMSAPFLEARVNVVLFREPWGETPWTRVEQTAITGRCLKEGWDTLFFVMLDPTSPTPDWLPPTYIRFNIEDYGIQQAIGAIKLRVEQRGGKIAKLSPMARAKRVKEEHDLEQERHRRFRNQKWIEDTVKPTIVGLMKSLCEEAQRITEETDLRFECVHEPFSAGFDCVMRYGRVTLGVSWPQQFVNVIDDVKLAVIEYNGRVHLEGERKKQHLLAIRNPAVMNRRAYRPTLILARPDELYGSARNLLGDRHRLLHVVVGGTAAEAAAE